MACMDCMLPPKATLSCSSHTESSTSALIFAHADSVEALPLALRLLDPVELDNSLRRCCICTASSHSSLTHLAIDLIQVQGLGGDLHLQLGSRLIDQVNGLVREEAVRNVAVRQDGRLNKGGVADAHAVVHLVPA